MKQTRLLMGMPVTVEIAEPAGAGTDRASDFAAVFDYFTYIDGTFSTYRPESEMMRINRGEVNENDWSDDMRTIVMLSEETRQRTAGFFDIKKPDGSYDPSGIVKGWAIWNAAKILESRGFRHFYIDAGGDIQTSGMKDADAPWRIGIKNPFKPEEVAKIIRAAMNEGVATSGTYLRGEHIYNPITGMPANEIASLTVIGPNVYEADRFATAAFAMGREGISFIEQTPHCEGYLIDNQGIATMTTGFDRYAAE